MPFPDSGVYAALGYSEASGIPFEMGMIRNHYVGRTFISPAQKVRVIRSLERRGFIVGMVGDGVNDAAAMAAADVSIGVTAGAELAAEVAGVAWHGEADLLIAVEPLESLRYIHYLSPQAAVVVSHLPVVVAVDNHPPVAHNW